jgi:tyrosinase
MFVRKGLSLGLAILWSTVCVFCSYYPPPCTKPAVRREWRAFSTEEKAEWIRAVKVRIDTLIGRLAKAIFGIQCLSKLPHDPALTPSVDPSLSLIPPLNTSSSYYDGTTQSFSLAFQAWGVLTTFSSRLSIPPHGSKYSGTSE